MRSLTPPSNHLAQSLCTALLALSGWAAAGQAIAQKADLALTGAGTPVPVLAPFSGPAEPQGQWLQARDVRAREMRSAFRTPAQPAPETALNGHKLSATEREALRAQLRGQTQGAGPAAADSKPVPR